MLEQTIKSTDDPKMKFQVFYALARFYRWGSGKNWTMIPPLLAQWDKELLHHAAEFALLRDLWSAQSR